MTNVELLEAALRRVESESIKAWASTANNRPIFEQIAEKALEKDPAADPDRLAAYVVCLAIGA
jgi:hypothetical protein